MTITPVLIYGQPAYIPPPPPIDPGWTPLTMWLENENFVDGNGDPIQWSLTSPDEGLVLMPGVRGLAGLSIENHRDDYAAVAGSYWRDYRALMREAYLPLYLFHDGSSVEWMARNDAFLSIMDPGEVVSWCVQRADGTVRRLRLRYDKGLEDAYDTDPTMFGWAKYGVYLDADQPYWEGDPILTSFIVSTSTPASFFGAGNVGGPPFYIAGNTAGATSTVANPGRVAVWPKYTITGPLLSISITVAGNVITVPFALSASDVLVIDCDPTVQSAYLNGVDVTGNLTSFGFAQIDRGSAVPVKITPVADPGSAAQVTVELTPLYLRAV